MPVYEYRCDVCNLQFELRQKFSDPPADQCPECSGNVRKMVSSVSFSLKGAGWFGDGYGAKAEPTNSEGDTVAGGGTATEVVSSDATPAVTTASPSVQTPAPTQVESEAKAAETPTATRENNNNSGNN